MDERMFPIQSQVGAAPHPTKIPWSIADLAYSVYSARYGRGKSLERLAERAGFAPSEMDEFVPEWREMCSRIAKQSAEIDRLTARCKMAEDQIEEDRAIRLKIYDDHAADCAALDREIDRLTALGEALRKEHEAARKYRTAGYPSLQQRQQDWLSAHAAAERALEGK